jgi:WhiB family redox-sensing transcriptional regulator
MMGADLISWGVAPSSPKWTSVPSRRTDDHGDNAATTPCERLGPALWFSDLTADLDLAKAFCHTCLMRIPCLDGARARQEPHGVWGGELFQDGVVIPRKPPRGRPPKRKRRVLT